MQITNIAAAVALVVVSSVLSFNYGQNRVINTYEANFKGYTETLNKMPAPNEPPTCWFAGVGKNFTQFADDTFVCTAGLSTALVPKIKVK